VQVWTSVRSPVPAINEQARGAGDPAAAAASVIVAASDVSSGKVGFAGMNLPRA
jgi:hypothetical protein